MPGGGLAVGVCCQSQSSWLNKRLRMSLLACRPPVYVTGVDKHHVSNIHKCDDCSQGISDGT